MTHRRAVVVLALSCGICVSHAHTPVQTPVFRTTTDLVSVDVSVTNGRAPIAGLTSADFGLTDNGVRQDVEATSLETIPVDVTVVLGAAPFQDKDQLVRSQVSGDQVWSMLHPNDRLRLITAGGEVRGGPITRENHGPMAEDKIHPTAGNSLNDALFLALAWPVDADRRHLVVVFTDGFDTWSTLDSARLPLIAGRADAVLHAVLWATPPKEVVPEPGSDQAMLQGPTPGPRPPDTGLFSPTYAPGKISGAMSPQQAGRWRESYRALDQAVRNSGGALHLITAGVNSFQQILDDFRSSYVLRYTPRGVARTGWHDIKVTLARSGSFTIRARKGYEGG
jgi:hypothetical protein